LHFLITIVNALPPFYSSDSFSLTALSNTYLPLLPNLGPKIISGVQSSPFFLSRFCFYLPKSIGFASISSVDNSSRIGSSLTRDILTEGFETLIVSKQKIEPTGIFMTVSGTCTLQFFLFFRLFTPGLAGRLASLPLKFSPPARSVRQASSQKSYLNSPAFCISVTGFSVFQACAFLHVRCMDALKAQPSWIDLQIYLANVWPWEKNREGVHSNLSQSYKIIAFMACLFPRRISNWYLILPSERIDFLCAV